MYKYNSLPITDDEIKMYAYYKSLSISDEEFKFKFIAGKLIDSLIENELKSLILLKAFVEFIAYLVNEISGYVVFFIFFILYYYLIKLLLRRF